MYIGIFGGIMPDQTKPRKRMTQRKRESIRKPAQESVSEKPVAELCDERTTTQQKVSMTHTTSHSEAWTGGRAGLASCCIISSFTRFIGSPVRSISRGTFISVHSSHHGRQRSNTGNKIVPNSRPRLRWNRTDDTK